ncbi:hypothetical protein YN1_7300 [Nanoarchaeota archaeon]
MAKIFVKGERVSLGYFENKEEFLKYIENTDLELQQFLGVCGKFILTREVLENNYNKHVEEMKNKNAYFFAIILNSENKLIGTCSLYLNREFLKGSVAISLLKDYWGKGFGTEAMKLLLFFGFIILDLRKIELEVYTYNERGIKSYKKVGFREVGVRRKERYCMGEWRDLLLMEILREEFIEENKELIEKIKKLNNIII